MRWSALLLSRMAAASKSISADLTTRVRLVEPRPFAVAPVASLPAAGQQVLARRRQLSAAVALLARQQLAV